MSSYKFKTQNTIVPDTEYIPSDAFGGSSPSAAAKTEHARTNLTLNLLVRLNHELIEAIKAQSQPKLDATDFFDQFTKLIDQRLDHFSANLTAQVADQLRSHTTTAHGRVSFEDDQQSDLEELDQQASVQDQHEASDPIPSRPHTPSQRLKRTRTFVDLPSAIRFERDRLRPEVHYSDQSDEEVFLPAAAVLSSSASFSEDYKPRLQRESAAFNQQTSEFQVTAGRYDAPPMSKGFLTGLPALEMKLAKREYQHSSHAAFLSTIDSKLKGIDSLPTLPEKPIYLAEPGEEEDLTKPIATKQKGKSSFIHYLSAAEEDALSQEEYNDYIKSEAYTSHRSHVPSADISESELKEVGSLLAEAINLQKASDPPRHGAGEPSSAAQSKKQTRKSKKKKESTTTGNPNDIVAVTFNDEDSKVPTYRKRSEAVKMHDVTITEISQDFPSDSEDEHPPHYVDDCPHCQKKRSERSRLTPQHRERLEAQDIKKKAIHRST
jgi:hypothetical protein